VKPCPGSQQGFQRNDLNGEAPTKGIGAFAPETCERVLTQAGKSIKDTIQNFKRIFLMVE
jgi:hypothetical protein